MSISTQYYHWSKFCTEPSSFTSIHRLLHRTLVFCTEPSSKMEHSRQTKPMQWLLIPWFITSQGYEQQWYWLTLYDKRVSTAFFRTGTHLPTFASGQSVCTLRWRHNGHDSVSIHQPRDCFLNRLFRHRSKKTSKLRVTGLCARNSPEAGEFPAQRASNTENVSIWWRHHGRHGSLIEGWGPEPVPMRSKPIFSFWIVTYYVPSSWGAGSNAWVPRQISPQFELWPTIKSPI